MITNDTNIFDKFRQQNPNIQKYVQAPSKISTVPTTPTPTKLEESLKNPSTQTKESILPKASIALLGASGVVFCASALLYLKSGKKPKTIAATGEELIPFTIKNLSETKLGQEYNKTKSGFLNFINGLKNKEPKDFKEFLFAITSNKEQSAKFVEEVANNPRESKKIINTLIEKIGGIKNFNEWYTDKNGYMKAYQRYANKLYDSYKKGNASLDELIKFAPNWKLYSISDGLDKFGKIPKDLNLDNDKYVELIQEIRNRIGTNVKEFDFRGIKVHFLPSGASSKSIVKIDSKGKNYILKIENVFIPEEKEKEAMNRILEQKEASFHDTLLTYLPFISSNKQNQYNLRTSADSIFTNAQIDWYLTQNKCKNAAKLFFYDSKTESSIYEYLPRAKSAPSRFSSHFAANSSVKDLNDLGIFINDINEGNFSNGKVIDIGHATFKDLLRPITSPYSTSLPNGCGFDYTEVLYKNYLGL